MNPPELGRSLEESIGQVMHTLPVPIRRYLGEGKYAVVAQSLAKKYGLRADQGNILEREVAMLLMGVDNPDEFVQSLVVEANINQQTANGITHDVNEQIFVPLRDEVQRAGVDMSQLVPQQRVAMPPPNYAPPRPPAQAPVPVPPSPTPATPPPAPQQWASQFPESSTVIQANPSLPPRPAQVADSMMRYTPLPKQPSIPRNIPPTRPNLGVSPPSNYMPPRSAPVVQKPVMNSNRMLEDHEEPSPSMRRAPLAPMSAGLKPPVPAQRTYTPPTNLPGAMPPPQPRPMPAPPRPVTSFPPMRQTPPVPPRSTMPLEPQRSIPPIPPPTAPRPPAVEHYSDDPYREPLEEATAE